MLLYLSAILESWCIRCTSIRFSSIVYKIFVRASYIKLKIKKTNFKYKPGQFVYVSILQISVTSRPFYVIPSDKSSDELSYILL